MAKLDDGIGMSRDGISTRPHHLYSDPAQIKGVQTQLRAQGWQARCVVKQNHSHLFFTTDYELKSIRSRLGPQWLVCEGCDMCKLKLKPAKKQRYVLYPPLVLLPTHSLTNSEDAQQLLAEHPQCTHVAINAPVKTKDVVRRPQITPLIGDFGNFVTTKPTQADFDAAFWATSFQNQIHQTWAPLYTMFSRGNVTEKRRVLTSFANQQPIADSTVVDLYAGIGYFTFPYAQQRPRVVYAWEINLWSIEGLRRAAIANRLNCRIVHEGEIYTAHPSDQIVVFAEDNVYAIERIPSLELRNLSHINMGLLPNAHAGIPVALRLARESLTPTIVHLHENVPQKNLPNWQSEMERVLNQKCVHLEIIKQFSPGVVHVCGDFA